MGCGTNIVPGFDAVNKQVKDYPLEMKIMAEFNASESDKKDYSKEVEKKFNKEYEKLTIMGQHGPLRGKELKEYKKNKLERAIREDKYQRMMNIDVELMQGDIDHAALNALGGDVRPLMTEAFVGKSGQPEALAGSVMGGGAGRYYWLLYGGTREGVLDTLLGWGRPTAVVWFDEASNIGTSSYNPRHDSIKIRNYTKLLGNRTPLLGSILHTHLHETFHWADYTLGRHVYNRRRSDGAPVSLSAGHPRFEEAFFEDAVALGITADKYGGPTNENQFEGEGMSRTRVAHDSALAEIIFYEYMLDHPRIYERIFKEIKEHQEMLAKADASYAFDPQNEMSRILKEIHIPNKKSETLKHLYGTEWMTDDGSVHSTMNQFIFDSEVTNRLGNNLPSRNEMMAFLKLANRRMTDAIKMNNVLKARIKLFEKVKKEMDALGDRRNELDGYMDILDAMSGGAGRSAPSSHRITGHGERYFNSEWAAKEHGPEELIRRRLSETFAQLGAAWANVDRSDWNRMKEKLPNLTREFENIMEKYKDTVIEPRYTSSSQAVKDLGLEVRSYML